VIRSSVERIGATLRPDVFPIAASRAEAPCSTASIPMSRPNCRAPSGDGHAKATIRLSELVGEQDILLRVRADGKRAALSGIAARLAEKVGRSRGAVLAALLRRERLGSTAIGNRIAIPHSRLEGIAAPAAVLATLQRPVAFGTPDDASVDLLFALLWPTLDSRGFVPALRGVWRHLRSAGLAYLLRQSRTPAEAHAWFQIFEEEGRERLTNPPLSREGT
jgi:PTS system nitrogen regulatory IIA component